MTHWRVLLLLWAQAMLWPPTAGFASMRCSTHLQTRLAPEPQAFYPLVIAVFTGEGPSNGYKSVGGSYSARRESVRQTWGALAHKAGVPLFFVLSSFRLLEKNWEEAQNKHDLLLLDDPKGEAWGYEKLTAKTLRVIQFVANQCAKVKYLLKCDDDTYVHMPRLLVYIELSHGRYTMAGKVHRKSRPMLSGQWALRSFEPTTGLNRYPRYCMGGGYLLSGDLVTAIAATSEYVPLQLWSIEDMSLGVWTVGWNITVVDFGPYGLMDNIDNSSFYPLCHDRWYMVHRVYSSDMPAIYDRACRAMGKYWRDTFSDDRTVINYIPQDARL